MVKELPEDTPETEDKNQVETKTAADFQPDTANANRGTQRGTGMLARSLENYGAGRSGLADKNGKIIAGNHTLQQVSDMGLPIKVVHTTGQEWVIVQRDDLDLDDEDNTARALAVLDNRTGEINLEWSAETLANLQDEGLNLEEFWHPSELEKLARDLGRETELAALNASAEAAYIKAHKTISKCMELVTGHLALDSTTTVRIQPELLELQAALNLLINSIKNEDEPAQVLEQIEREENIFDEET